MLKAFPAFEFNKSLIHRDRFITSTSSPCNQFQELPQFLGVHSFSELTINQRYPVFQLKKLIPQLVYSMRFSYILLYILYIIVLHLTSFNITIPLGHSGPQMLASCRIR